MRRRASAYDAVTDVIALPCSRAAASALRSSSTLRALLDRLGQRSTSSADRDGVAGGSSATTCVAAATAARRAGRGLGRVQQSVRREVGGVREAGRVAAHDAEPGAAVAAGDELLDPAVVETSARRPPILDEHLGEVAAAAQRVVERRLQDVVCRSASVMRLDAFVGSSPTCRGDAGLPIVSAMPLAPGLTASVTLVVDEADTALAMRQRRRARARHAAGGRARRAGERRGDRPTSCRTGRTTVGYEVQLAHLTPTPVGGKVVAEATLEQVEGRRLTFRVSVNDARGLVAAGRITRVVVERDRFLERAQTEGR